MRLLLRWLVPFVAVIAASRLRPDLIAFQDLSSVAIFALVLAVLNAVVRPVVEFLAMPITCLTLGLFHFVINAILFAVAAALVSGVMVNGFLAALLGALVVSAVGLVLSLLVR